MSAETSPIPSLILEERWDPLGAAANDDDNENDIKINDFDLKKNVKSIFINSAETTTTTTTIPTTTLLNNEITYCENYDNFINYSNNYQKNSTASSSSSTIIDTYRIKSLEDEQEILTTSLMALTSHFAQVQFRLRQIVEAPINERDQLLKNLEEFAFRGIPEITGKNTKDDEMSTLPKHIAETARERQFELIDQLKKQLTDLEKFAYESGAPVLPQSILLEKQKIIIDELKSKLNLNVNEADLPQLTTEDLKNQVDLAIGEIIGPIKMKEQLVAQLKTQITDLERFIAFLQCESEDTRLKALEIGNYNYEFSPPSSIISPNLQTIKKTPTSTSRNTTLESINKNFLNTFQNNSNCYNNIDNDLINNKKYELLAYNSYAAKKKAAEKFRSRNLSSTSIFNYTIQYDNENSLNSYSNKKDIFNCNKTTTSTATTTQLNVENENIKTKKKRNLNNKYDTNINNKTIPTIPTTTASNNINNSGTLNQKAHNLLDKAATVLHMFVLSQFGCSSISNNENRSDYFYKNSLKKTQTGNHWGDIRAQLELDIQEILRLLMAAKLDDDKKIDLKKSLSKNTNIENLNKKLKKKIEINNSKMNNITDLKIPITEQYAINNSYNTNLTSIQKFKKHNSKLIHDDDDVDNNEFIKKKFKTNIELTKIIRRNFAVTLQKLIQHGLKPIQQNYNGNNLIVPFMGCFNVNDSVSDTINMDYFYLNENNSKLIKKKQQQQRYKNKNNNNDNDDFNMDNNDDDDDNDVDDDDDDDEYNDVFKKNSSKYVLNNIDDDHNNSINNIRYKNNINNSGEMHAWELILEYYNVKNGESFNDAPIRKLSQSFNLDISGSQNLSSKQSLLSSIGNIINIHAPYKRSYNSHFKAFICSALNCHKLVQWLNVIFQCTELIQNYYYPWSYVARTGFQDALRSLDTLTKYNFNLPVDLAVRQFENIKDVFM